MTARTFQTISKPRQSLNRECEGWRNLLPNVVEGCGAMKHSEVLAHRRRCQEPRYRGLTCRSSLLMTPFDTRRCVLVTTSSAERRSAIASLTIINNMI